MRSFHCSKIRLILIGFVAAIIVGGGSAKADITLANSKESSRQAAMSLLEAHVKHRERLKSFVIKQTTHTQMHARITEDPYRALSGDSDKMLLEEIYTNGDMYARRFYRWGNIRSATDYIPKGDACYNILLYNGTHTLWYVASMKINGRVDVFQGDVTDKPTKSYSFSRSYGLLSCACLWPDINETLRKADRLSVRHGTFRVKDRDCYVIDAVTDDINYVYWIDPSRGYAIIKSEVRCGDSRVTETLYNIELRQIEGMWLPVGAYRERQERFEGGNFLKTYEEIYIHEITLNPDHDKLRSFQPYDIKNGARVRIDGRTKGPFRMRNGREYDRRGQSDIWRDGKVLDTNGKVILDFSNPYPNGASVIENDRPVGVP